MALIGTIGIPSMYDASRPLRASRTDVTFTYTGASQAWTVPAGIDIIVAHLWGGGASSGYDTNNVVYGGAGGFTTGLLQVTPGEILRVMVGGRGENSQGSEVYGGGGGVDHDYNSSTGAGRSAIFRGPDTNISNSTELCTAGGGGGGGEDSTNNSNGGAGGGIRGADTINGTSIAYGGTQTAKGGHSGNANGDLGGDRCRGGHNSTKYASGGGGGGYYGGGDGAQDESGAGGSGYVGGMIYGLTFQGAFNVIPSEGSNHTKYPGSSYGAGQTTGGAVVGNHGVVVIEY